MPLEENTHQSGYPGVNFFVDGEGPTTSIVRSVLSHIAGSEGVVLKLAENAEYSDYQARPTIFSRVCSPTLAWLPETLSEIGARYAFYLDDNLWEYRNDNELGQYYARPDVRRSLDQFVNHATIVIVNSEFLAGYVRLRFPGLSVLRVPAPFDFSKLVSTEGDFHMEKVPTLRVGYAGTERGDAFLPVAAAIKRVLQARPGQIEFEFIGYAPSSLEGLNGVRRFIEIGDYGDFLVFKRSRQWHAALAPLASDSFSSAKTNNKYREYGAMGITGLYSAAGPYLESVQDGFNGLLVDDGEDNWVNALLWLIDNPALRESIGERAREDVWRKHRLEVVAEEWSRGLGHAQLRPLDSGFRSTLIWTIRRFLGGMKGRMENYSQLRRKEGLRVLIVHIARKLKSLLRIMK